VTADAPTDDAPDLTSAWSTGRVDEVQRIGDHLVRLRLELAERSEHLPGQHCVVRLRAEDGYTAQRSYSIASDPADPLLELMVECLPGGEVSGFLHDEVRVDDVLEVRSPIGGWFTWTGDVTAIGVAGGSGVVPLVSMQRYAARLGIADRLRLVVVARTFEALPYARELLDGGAFVALTRENLGTRIAHPPYPDEVEALAEGVERAYVCGSVGFASFATRLLGEVGVRSDVIRVEQFGATG
jgi:ferredoxin-NADP reductase